ncbi:hypothetical protein JNW91_13205 [Micromonospora sp. STR1_7]|uniref:Uncharacterized protein n=1 Tax=Micromonospora parastrephiae TaxID=2806101 RepID=A0ABS1XTZ3_9ACTN|nr:hypothetical protein [Micromonospora parastrephiae]MBM0232733.1 hypothetical protein [Micromonospora parastrephiae]
MFNTEYPALGDDVLVAKEMAERLGGKTLSDLLHALWRGDCQTCGSSLISGPISVYAEIMLVMGHVSLHHPTCQVPLWNDGDGGGVIFCRPSLGDHVTYLHTSMIVDGIPIVLLNVSLEMASLSLDHDDKWYVSNVPLFRDYHKMFPGGPIPMPPLQPAVGISLEVSEDAIDIRSPQTWRIRPGAQVIDAVRRNGGLLLAISSMYHGQHMTPHVVNKVLQHPERTALGWISLRATPAPGAPAAEYAIYRNRHFTVAGLVLARNRRVDMAGEEAKEWGKGRAREFDELPAPSFIDHPVAYDDELSRWFMDAISLGMYVVVPAADGWRLIKSYSRFGERLPDTELSEWAGRVMQRKSHHRMAAVEWVAGPSSNAGEIMLSHVLPSDS